MSVLFTITFMKDGRAALISFNKYERRQSMNKDLNDIFNDDPWLDQYSCYECGAVMDIVGDVLVCPKCGHSVKLED